MNLDGKTVEKVIGDGIFKKVVLLSLVMVLLAVIVSAAKATMNCELTFTPPNTEVGTCIYVYTPSGDTGIVGGDIGLGVGNAGCGCGSGPTALGGTWGQTIGGFTGVG